MKHRGCDCTRRSFLRGSGLTLAGFSLGSLVPSGLLDHALAGGFGATDKKLFFIFLRGGIDGINTVIPQGDPDYNTTLRPTLFIPSTDSIDLGNGFARLHPSLGDAMELYNAGELALIHRTGYPGSSLSHFDGQRLLENGTVDQTLLFEGWLYRYIMESAIAQGATLPVMSVQAIPPLSLRGEEAFVNVANPDEFDYKDGPPKGDKYRAAWRQAYEELSGQGKFRPALSDTGVKLIDTLDLYRSWDQAGWDPKDPNDGESLFPVDAASNNGRFSDDSYGFFHSLKIAALSLLEDAVSDNGTRIVGTEQSSYDTHSDQGQMAGRHPELLEWLAYGLRSLRLVLSGAANDPRSYPSIWNDTVVFTMSEFGRTSAENGSFGTDHAKATVTLVAGGPVNGGVYNCDGGTWPAGVMFEESDRYLSYLTDNRAILWELLRDHMGATPGTRDTIFPGYDPGLVELGLIGT